MSAEVEQREVVIQKTTRLSREEIRSVAPDIQRILDRLALPSLTGSVTIRTNRGGVCEIEYHEKNLTNTHS